MTEKEALILLNGVDGIGPRSILRIKQLFPSVVDVFGKSEKELVKILEIPPDLVRNILKAPGKPDLKKELEFIEREKIRVLSLWDPDYPYRLSQIYDPPPVIYIKGQCDLNGSSVAVVGARISTHYGNHTAYRLAFQLASCGVSVISGLARGIDTHAHRGALTAKGVTVGVMGCGFQHFYPKENRSLAEEIMGKGCLISEFPSKVPPLGKNFPKRNRIISGLSLGVVIVEAAHRSGSLITADLALEQGRSVFAVPGQVDSPSASGTLGLIKDGARLVQTVEDILEELGLEISYSTKGSDSTKEVLDSDEGLLLDLIGNDPMDVDEVSLRSKMGTSKVLSLLFGLELRRLVKQLPGKYYVRA